MANKYIKDLITTTNPSLTGHTIFDNGVTTFKTSLETLKDTIVDGLSHTFEGDQTINGNLVISGSVVAQEFILSSSITNVEIQNISGSSNFGNDLEDTHNFTGSVNITGSLYLNNGEVNISGSGSHLAFFTGPQSITSSHDFHIIENGHTLALGIDVTSTTFGDEEYRERLIVGNSDSHNIATFQITGGNHYAAVNIINYNDGDNASADLVIMNNIQDESGSYFNLGLNSTNHTNLFCGYAGDAYLYTTSHDLYMGSMFVGTGVTGNGHTHIFGGAAWRSPSVSIYSDTSVGFFTEKFNNQLSTIPSFNQGFKTEFSGSVKMNNNLKVDGSVTASYFVGDGSQLINLPTQEIDTDSLATTGSNTFEGDQTINGNLTIGTVSENVISYVDWVGNLVFDYGDGSIFYITGLTSNGQFNVFNVPETNDKAVTFTFVIEQGSVPYSGSLYMINDSEVDVKWVDNIIPTGSANKTNIIGLTAFRINSTWNVLGALSTFG